MLCSALNSHPEITCFHEPFMDIRKREQWSEQMDLWEKPVRIGHVQFHQLHSSMLEADIPRLLLARRDVVRSAMGALFLNVYRPNQKFSVDPEYVMKLRDERLLHYKLMKASCEKEVFYEDLTDNKEITEIPERWGRWLCDWAGVDYHPLEVSVRKARVSLPWNLEEIYGSHLS